MLLAPRLATTGFALLSLTGAGVAAAGAAMVVTTLTRELPAAPPLPPPGQAATAQAGEAATAAATPATVWPAVFGAPRPVAEPRPAPPEPEPVEAWEPDEPWFDPDAYVLRGVVVQGTGGWAMLETDEGIIVVRPGDMLPDGAMVIDVTDQGVEIDADGDSVFLVFDDSMDSGAGAPAAGGFYPDGLPPPPREPRAAGAPPYDGRFGLGTVGR